MAQTLETRCLTEAQVSTVINNYVKVNNYTGLKIIDSGKPVFSKENEAKYGIPHITMFADKYVIYQMQMPDTKKSNLFVIVMYATKFNKYFLTAAIFYYKKYIEANIDVNGVDGRPQVILAPAWQITETMRTQHVPVNIFPCLYRFMSLVEVYPMIGSRNGLYGMTYDYERTPFRECYNGRLYPVIYDSDPMVKLLNAMPGELIKCRRVLQEGEGVYNEYSIRQVVTKKSEVGVIVESGICEGQKYKALKEKEEQALNEVSNA